jgi:small-conductance mechanosensitive channel
MTTPDWLYRSFLGNSVHDWLIASGSAIAVMTAVVALRTFVLLRLAAPASRTEKLAVHAPVELLRSIRKTYVVVVVFCLAGLWLDFSPRAHDLLRDAAIVFAVLQGALSGTRFVSWWLARYARARGEIDRTTVAALGIAGKALVWGALLLIGAENLGLHVQGILTGLGIGGIAIALAVQNVLGELFAALSIVLDKPFVVGDSIAVDAFEGTVERIGLKSTRVQSINGELVVFSNGDLLKSRVRNLSRRTGLRMVFTVSVDPATKAGQLARVPALISAIVAAEPRAELRYCTVVGAGARGFDVETAIAIRQPYGQALDVRQSVLLGCYARLEQEGIALARPPGASIQAAGG